VTYYCSWLHPEAELLSRQLFASQLYTSAASQAAVLEAFSRFGQVQQVQIKRKTISAHGKNWVVPNAVVEYQSPAAAAATLSARTTEYVCSLNGRNWGWRQVLQVNDIGNLKDTSGNRYAL
jgi:hypothetical protein